MHTKLHSGLHYEVGEHFHFKDNDKQQHQTSVSSVDLRGTSNDRVLTKTVPKGSSSSIGMPFSYRDLKQTKEKQSQQSSQLINDKYFFSTFFVRNNVYRFVLDT